LIDIEIIAGERISLWLFLFISCLHIAFIELWILLR